MAKAFAFLTQAPSSALNRQRCNREGGVCSCARSSRSRLSAIEHLNSSLSPARDWLWVPETCRTENLGAERAVWRYTASVSEGCAKHGRGSPVKIYAYRANSSGPGAEEHKTEAGRACLAHGTVVEVDVRSEVRDFFLDGS